jgi:hypothetical protein
MSELTGIVWALVVIGGPVLLALALWYGIRHSRRRATGPIAPRSYDHSGEAGTAGPPAGASPPAGEGRPRGG